MWKVAQEIAGSVAPWIALFLSCGALYVANASYRLAKRLQVEMKGDEILVAGELSNPQLLVHDHRMCVLQTTLFNKAKRKAYVSKVEVFDGKGQAIEVTWSAEIDAYGNPVAPSKLIGVVDSSPFCVRRNDGLAFLEASVEVTHSFASKPLVLSFSFAPG
ncbi:MAG: hypothetical protein ABI583_08430 [Betaproteobacteria bacterium]